MRTKIILAVAAITIPVLAYTFMREDAASGQPQAVISQNGASSGAKDQGTLDKLANDLEHYQLTNQAQFERAQQEQARLSAALAALATRLGSVETAVSEPRTNVVGRNRVEQSTDTADLNNGTGNDGTGKPESRKVSETDLGHWIDETIRIGSGDAYLTAKATEQAAVSLRKFPNVNLENMQCDQRFCRATFTKTNSKESDIQALYGEPPFVSEGFTINEADGRVLLYFTQPGVSLADLRGEAQGY